MSNIERCRFYVASCERDGGIFLCEYREDKAEIIGKTPMDRPMYMTADNGKMYVILRQPFDDNNSGVVAYDITESGLENPGEIISTKGVVACHICVLDGCVYCVNYLSGSVIKLPDILDIHSGSGINEKRQDMPHTHYINSFDGKYLLCCDLGTDEIYTYDKNLKVVSKAKVPSGHGARHLEYKDGYIYCANELESTVSVFEYDNGILNYKTTTDTLPPDFKGENTVAAIRVHGKYLYVSNRGHDSITVFELCDNMPKVCGYIDCGGGSPRDFNIFGDLLVCTNENSNNVTFFDVSEGVPKPLNAELKIKSPLCVIKSE